MILNTIIFFTTLIFFDWVRATTHEVIVSSNVFTPNTLEIEAGDTVRWINTGGGHNVRASDGSFRCAQGCDADGGDGNPSAELWTFEVTLRTIGTVAYICEPHIGFGMQGSITVVEPYSINVHEIHATANNEFNPDEMTIQRGDVIRFINDGGVHNIHSDDGNLICSEGCLGDGTNTDNDATGFPWDLYVRFNEIAKIPYFCAEHDNTGIIHVLTDTLFMNGFE